MDYCARESYSSCSGMITFKGNINKLPFNEETKMTI